MKTKLIILFFLFVQTVYSQKNFLDYAITEKNDTIYGTFKNDALIEKNLNPEKDGIKFYSHNVSKMKSIRFNDDLYFPRPLEDGIYMATPHEDSINFVLKSKGFFLNKSPRLQDFAVLKSNDTVFGEISEPLFGNLYLSDKDRKKYSISSETVKAYRFKNDLYECKEKIKVDLFDTNKGFLKVLVVGKVNLYEYEYRHNTGTKNFQQPTKYYFIEKDNQLVLLNSIIGALKIKKKLIQIFIDDQELVGQISEDIYGLQNIYLIVKKYNYN